MTQNNASLPDDFPVVPVVLNELAGYSTSCPCGKTHSIETKRFVIDYGAATEVVSMVKSFCPGDRIGLVGDRNTFAIAGKAVLENLVSAGYRVTQCVVDDAAGGRPHATFETVLTVEHQFTDVDFVVAVGSGTINDLGKLASFRLGVDYLIVATAPSMNGYTSAIAAIMKDGLKCTMDCHQPVVVIADLDILCRAPVHLIRAGLGDLESKPVSTADFRLSSLLRGTYYCPVPGQVVAEAEQRAAACAEKLSTGDPEAIRTLIEALLLSGCSMKLAGSSSPASGGEHLISHYWDMTADAENRVEGFHGAQVGVATIVTATLYEYLQRVPLEQVDVDLLVRQYPSIDSAIATVARRHGEFGELAAGEFQQKHLSSDEYRRELLYVLENWSDIWEALSMLKPAAQIRNTLAEAGCPVTMHGIDLSEHHLRKSFLYAREIRGRFTVLDFAADLGLLDDAADWVLNQSGCLLK